MIDHTNHVNHIIHNNIQYINFFFGLYLNRDQIPSREYHELELSIPTILSACTTNQHQEHSPKPQPEIAAAHRHAALSPVSNFSIAIAKRHVLHALQACTELRTLF